MVNSRAARGNAMKDGDMFICISGCGSGRNGAFTSYDMFRYDSSLERGEGRVYDDAGNPDSYHWADPKESVAFPDVPADILSSFEHGTKWFNVPDDKVQYDCIERLVRDSDFKFAD